MLDACRSSDANAQPNLFVETALAYALTYISTLIEPVVFPPAIITILADDDYYSSQAPNAQKHAAADSKSKQFQDFGVPLQEAHKTGLGSSAALVTAFIGAVLLHYTSLSLTEEKTRRLLHNLAQAAHSAAQGKIGSGFDVASAVYGSCIYRRFSPSLLESTGDCGTENFIHKLKAVVEEQSPADSWDTEIAKSKISVPKGLRLVMCDVDCGSSTPGMVKKVLEWRRNNQTEADELWTYLQSKNEELSAELLVLSSDSSTGYDQLANIIQDIRRYVRKMSALSQVPIEPQAQTRLLDACTELPGVVGGMAPGAGGYDAVALLVEDRPEVIERLSRLLVGWAFHVEELGVDNAGSVRLLDVRQEMEGVREEHIEQYGDWVKL